MTYNVSVIHPVYGELKVSPSVFNEEQLKVFTDFCVKHDLVFVIEEVIE